ncbi:MAG: hypothetical protein LBC90_03385 [Candidatus Adiutrix sp.]|jgi:hypothetical protein|nr:hypothetical protein [Candidatus Adiutrix sp.]
MKPFVLLGLFLAGCGYQASPSPYSLLQPLTLSVPVAVNQSRFGDLGPRLTREIIGLLDSSSNVTVRETAPATLKLAITGVEISGGAWSPERNEYDLPQASASRVVNLKVEAVLEKAGENGAASARRLRVESRRNYYVNDDEYQTQLLEAEAFNWVLADLAQKITQGLFSEF